MTSVPVIDISPFISGVDEKKSNEVVESVFRAFSTLGFIQVVGHNVSVEVQRELEEQTRNFFDLSLEEKMKVSVQKGGVAWRGYMPYNGEGTHGKPDAKEGFYLGPEHPDDHPLKGMPLHGKNQFPDEALPHMRGALMAYIDQVTQLGKTLTQILSLSLGFERDKLLNLWLSPEPIAIVRSFRYSKKEKKEGELIEENKETATEGIGKHTDFGYLTILKQDSPGLQMYSNEKGWIDVPVVENAFVVNVGDMLDMLTGGRFKSMPHRVVLPKEVPSNARLSWPFFFDFSWNAEMKPLDLPKLSDEEMEEAKKRWAGTTFTAVSGQWWQYLAKKVMKVFPNLKLPEFENNSSPSSRFTISVPT
eukprot:TRINITY_DN7121_c0_g1_i1.p1 TRINITY_DN7121_c0_g1~~TRINITY_DN7121_c0_g1_i1.p1  ORF type:complete len:361 (+),score=102.39 TRINITY_DN7121_c0_g1_i1:101-1183(+)